MLHVLQTSKPKEILLPLGFSVPSVILADLLGNLSLLVIGAFRSALFVSVSRFVACDRPFSGSIRLVFFDDYSNVSFCCLLQE